MPILQVRLMLGIMQLRLDSRRIDLYYLHITRTVLRLRPERQNEMVQGSLGCTVSRGAKHRDKCHLRGRVDQRGLVRLLLEIWQECLCETHGGGIVGEQFLVEDVDVDGSRVGEIESTLDSGVDEDAIQIRIFGDNF